MKQFLKDFDVTVAEFAQLKKRLLDTQYSFHFSRSQFENRLYGRVKLSSAENELMQSILIGIRDKNREEEERQKYFNPLHRCTNEGEDNL